ARGDRASQLRPLHARRLAPAAAGRRRTLCAPVALVGIVLALGRRDGLPADRLARLALRQLSSPRRRVLAPEGIPAALPGQPRRTAVAPLDLPVRTVYRSGLVELADGSFALVVRSASGSF